MSRVFGFLRSLKIRRPLLGLSILLLGLLATVLIAACGGDDPTPAPQAAATNTPQPPAPTAMPGPDPTAMPAMEPTAMPAVEPTAMPAMEGPGDFTVGVNSQGSLGSHLVDADGMALYLFTKDERNASNCSGGCADAWPPLLAEGAISAGEGLDGDRLTAISRDDGTDQVVYNGYPLYSSPTTKTPATRADRTGAECGSSSRPMAAQSPPAPP